MPQAIAMQLPVAAAAAPTATGMSAGSVSATAKVPMFAGLLLRFGRDAPPVAPPTAEAAIAKDASLPGAATQQSAPAELPGTDPADQGPLPPDTAWPAVLPVFAPPPLAPSSGPPPIPEIGPSVRPRLAVAAHCAAKDLIAAAKPDDATDVVAGATLPPGPILAIPPSQNVPETPHKAPVDGRARGPRLDGLAARTGPTMAEPGGTQPTSDPTVAAPANSAVAANIRWPDAPVAAGATQPSSPLCQPIATIAQPEPAAAVARLPETPGNVSATPADAATAPPAQQVSAALVSLAGAPGGGQRMTLRLEPAELGQVQIRIDRSQDAPAQVDITVQRPETLTLLLRDQTQLQRALDQAGVPPDGRSLTLHIAPPDAAAPSGTSHAGVAASADPGQDGGNGAGTKSGGQGRSGDAADQDQDDTAAPLLRWLRVGLDITA